MVIVFFFLTIDNKCEREILVKPVFLDSHQDCVLPSILLCNITDHQGVPINVITGALVFRHHAVLKPTRKKKFGKMRTCSFNADPYVTSGWKITCNYNITELMTLMAKYDKWCMVA